MNKLSLSRSCSGVHACMLAALALAVGCGGFDEGGSAPPAATTPASTADAGTSNHPSPGTDAGTPLDAGPTQDAAHATDAGHPSSGDSGAPSNDASASEATEYAPYFYTWGWGSNAYGFSSLTTMQSKGGPSAVTIAFVLSNGGCKVTTDIQDNLSDVKAYVAAGGHVKASFGGADGTYLESACSDAASMATAIEGFVDATGISDLDFDIEQGSSTSNATINTMRATALKTVQDSKDIRVAFTLPVNPDGLDDLGTAIVKSAVSAGVKISFVNVMTMDYGDSFSSMDLGQVAIGSAEATAKQLVTIVPNLTLSAAYRMVGVTPMIGHNDDSEVFSLDNAKTLVAWAKANKLGLLAFWAIQRDEACPGSTDLDTCTGVNASAFQFSGTFASVNQ